MLFFLLHYNFLCFPSLWTSQSYLLSVWLLKKAPVFGSLLIPRAWYFVSHSGLTSLFYSLILLSLLLLLIQVLKQTNFFIPSSLFFLIKFIVLLQEKKKKHLRVLAYELANLLKYWIFAFLKEVTENNVGGISCFWSLSCFMGSLRSECCAFIEG